MKRLLLLAAVLVPFAASAQSTPTYQPPSGITVTPRATPSATGAKPVSGSTAKPAPASTSPAEASTAGAPAPASSTAPAAPKAPTKATGAGAPNAAPSKSASAPSGSPTSVQEQKAQKVVTQIIQTTPVKDTPAVAARLPGLKSQPKLADIGDKLDYVQVVGTPSATATAAGNRVGIQWTTVTRTDTGQTVTLQAPLASNLRLKGDTLPAKTKVTARGDANEFYTAVRSLFENQPTDLQSGNAGSGQKKAAASSGGGGGGGQVGTQGDVTAKPQADNSDDSEDPESPPTYATTQEGCTIRVDLAQMQAIQQEALTTTKDGTTTRGACEDGSTRYPILKTGLGCDDVIGDQSAQGQTKLYYVGPDGKPVEVQACQPDPELIYSIVEEAASCAPFIDFNAGRVQDQVESVYRNSKNVRIIVAACHPTGEGYAIEYTTEGCSLRDDFDKGQTVQQQRPYYVKDGEQKAIGSCADSTNVYAHQTEACPDIVDSEAMKVFKASRIFIDGPNGKEYRSECAPYGDGTDLLATVSGCENVHYDYPSAAQSRGAERLYYMSNGAPIYLTQCQESKQVYPWNYVRTGWDNDDSALASTELLAAHITLPAPVGETEVSPAKIRPESNIVPYVPQGTQDVPNGQKTYEGCNAYVETTRSEVYQRADGTTYTVAIGDGDPQGPTDECTRTTESRDVWDHSSKSQSATPVFSTSKISALWNGSTSSPTCQGNQYDITSTSYGSWWNRRETRVITQLPAGAGGGTLTGSWTFQQYVQIGTFPMYTFTCTGTR